MENTKFQLDLLKRPLGRSKCRWEDNVKMDLKWYVDWTQGRVQQ